MKTLRSVHCPLMILMRMNQVLPILSHIQLCCLRQQIVNYSHPEQLISQKNRYAFIIFLMLPMRDEDAST